MGNDVAFSDKYIATMQRYADLENTIKELEDTKKKVRSEIQEAMEFYGIRSFENDILKLTLVAPSVSKTIDTSALRISEPDIYDELIEKYPKETHRKQSLRVTVR